jgi:hypothetical protein
MTLQEKLNFLTNIIDGFYPSFIHDGEHILERKRCINIGAK